MEAIDAAGSKNRQFHAGFDWRDSVGSTQADREWVILSVAGLGFLGLGIQPPAPEWGTMLVDARPFMQIAPYLVLVPGLAILITVFGYNSLGEGLDNLLNPKSSAC